MANPNEAAPSNSNIYLDELFMRNYREIDDAIDRDDLAYLRSHVKGPVNLSEDPLLNVLIACGKTEMVVKLVKDMAEEELEAANFDGDTALHVAAAVGDVTATEALIATENRKQLVTMANKLQETPLHKAALCGESDIFWKLVEFGDYTARGKDGANVLHCAIMGNAPRLALEIAKKYQDLMTSRNLKAVTPLQLLVTVPQAFRSKLQLGTMASLIYKWIPIEEVDGSTLMISKGYEEMKSKSDEEDIEKPSMHETSPRSYQPIGALDDVGDTRFIRRSRKIFPSNYSVCFDVLKLTHTPVRWIRLLVTNILKQLSTEVESLERKKRNHIETMKLTKYLASPKSYWDFILKGRKPKDSFQLHEQPEEHPTEATKQITYRDEKMTLTVTLDSKMALNEFVEQILKQGRKGSERNRWDDSPLTLGAKMGSYDFVEQILKQYHDGAERNRWYDSPLTLGAKMGLYDFVEQILKACPGSAFYPDEEGMNVLQIAIQNGDKKILGIVESMITGGNPVLPSSLLSSIDKTTKNTILHFAAKETVIKESAYALQMQDELLWFERVKQLVPKELEQSRNEREQTAQELFTENHAQMIQSAKNQLTGMATTCASLTAAVVFASGFTIPGDKDEQHNPVFLHRTAFKIYSHSYMVGLSCAATALVMNLLLLASTYREQDFRRSLPAKYTLAIFSFAIAMVALLLAFTCNFYLNIYGGMKSDEAIKNMKTIVAELIVIPILSCLWLFYRGSTISFHFLKRIWG